VCQACEKRSGLYLLTCVSCSLRLVEKTPRGPVRTAMWAHLDRSLTHEQREALRSAWLSRSAQSAPATAVSIGQCALDV
jgi:hypothetical protein